MTEIKGRDMKEIIEDRLLERYATGGIVGPPTEPILPTDRWPGHEYIIPKTFFGHPVDETVYPDGQSLYSIRFPVSDEMLIDAGLMDPPPIDAETRHRWTREARRRTVVYAIAKPLVWLRDGADWLHVEALNFGLWIVGSRSRVDHEDYRDEDDF